MSSRRRRQSGFTLLEVLAAVMILGLWYVTFAAMAVDGLRDEGISSRMLLATQMADRTMAEVEARALASGVPPVEDQLLRDDEEYTVLLQVAEFGIGAGLLADEVDVAAEDDEATTHLAQLIAARLPGLPQLLRTIIVRVQWRDGNEEREIRRVTYLFDEDAAVQLYEEAGLGAIPAEDDDDSSSEGDRGSSTSAADGTRQTIDLPDRDRSRPAGR